MRETDDSENLGQRLARVKAAYNLSLRQISTLLDISPQSVWRVLHFPNHRCHPFIKAKIERLVKIMEAKLVEDQDEAEGSEG